MRKEANSYKSTNQTLFPSISSHTNDKIVPFSYSLTSKCKKHTFQIPLDHSHVAITSVK